MKLHLPKTLLSAVLATCCVFSAQGVEIPDTHEPIDIWYPEHMYEFSSIAAAKSYALLLGFDTVAPADLTIDGGNLLFTSYDGLPPVSLAFSGGSAPVLSNQSTLVFDTLTRLSFADYSAGAICSVGNLSIQNVSDGVKNSENPDVFFSGNSASSSSSDYATSSAGGAVYSSGDVSINDNGEVSFTNNFAPSSSSDSRSYSDGGAIFADGDVNLIGNGDVNFTGNSASSASFSDCSAGSDGGAIFADGDVNLIGNGDVRFTGNSASSSSGYAAPTSESHGGAIHAYGNVSIIGNGDVCFAGNSAFSSSGFTHTSGGAIIVSNADVSINGNGDVSFTGNYASTFFDPSFSGDSAGSTGGAISSRDVSINGNGDVSFTGNYASSSSSGGTTVVGGAILSSDVSINGNGDVSFTGNYASSSSGASSSSSTGGAISSSDVSINGNGDVNFTGNYASSSSGASSSSSTGGAISSQDVSINGNGDVSFTGNYASSSGASSSSRGGAISAGSGRVSISGNETVCFEQNYERENSAYRLRSIYTERGSLNLSAKTGGHITFYDSVYGGTTVLNADYTDAEGNTQQAKGNIIFSGLYTKAHLDAILEANNEGREATEEEIQNSRTSTLAEARVYGGTLQVVDGAILETSSLGVTGNACVLLRDASVNGNIYFRPGASLELQGSNTSNGSLTLYNEVSLTVTLDNSHLETAALTLTGSVSTGTLSLNLNVAEERAVGMYRILSAGSLSTAAAWTAEMVNVQGSGAAAGAGFGDLLWMEGTLYYAASPVWSNYSGSGVWSSTATNWNNGSTFRAGQDVIFADRGAGEVQLVGELTPASILVQNSAGNDYAFTGSGRLSGATSLIKGGSGELTIATANDYTGRTELQEGTLNVHHSTALGATATGEASLTAAAGTTLKVGNSSHLVLAGCNNSLSGAVEVAAGATLEMKGSGYAATSSTVNGSLAFTGTSASMGTTTVNGTLAFTGTSATSGTLSGSGTVQVMDSQVGVESISSFTGNLKVEGKGSGLSIGEGRYTGSGTLQVSGGTLTFGGATAGISLDAGGQLVLQSWDDAVAGVTVNSITVRDGATLSALGDMPEISNHELSVDLNCARLTLNAGATLETEDVRFDLNNGVLTLAVAKGSTEKIELVLAENTVYTGSEQIALFTNVGQGVFVYDGILTNTGSESLYTLNAADYFTGNGISATTQLVYDSTTGVVYLEGVATVPEPTTATLSLLALAGLCARRRRK